MSTEITTIAERIESSASSLIGLLGSQDAVAHFKGTVLTLLTSDASLRACTPESVIDSCMRAARLRLTPGSHLGQAWLLPRKNVCTFQLGIKGVVVLLARVGIKVVSYAVYENDEFEFEKAKFGFVVTKHKPTLKSRGALIAAYAEFFLPDGTVITHVSGMDEIDRARMASASVQKKGDKWESVGGSSPWVSDEGEMARRVPVMRGWKYLSIEDTAVLEAMKDAEYAEYEVVNDRNANAHRPEYATQEAGRIETPPAALEISGPPPSPKKDMNAPADAEMKMNARNAFIVDAANGKHAYVDMAELDAAIEAATTRGELAKALNALKKPAQ